MFFLHLLEKIRSPFGDALMYLVTLFGYETLFMVIALVFFWCVDKKRGYYLLFAGFSGVICVQLLKMLFRIPRPWVLDPELTIVERARESATGYSFPSGHTQCAVTLYGGIARSSKRRASRIFCIVVAVLVGFSRMYLGVHTPKDVLVSAAIGVGIVFLLHPAIYGACEKPSKMYLTLGILLALVVANLLFVNLYPFPSGTDAANLEDARKVALQLLFVLFGMCIIYPVDTYVLRFKVEAVFWAQLCKLAGGVALVLALRALLKAPLNALCGVALGGAIRYFLMVLAAGILWPMTFRFWGKLGRKSPRI